MIDVRSMTDREKDTVLRRSGRIHFDSVAHAKMGTRLMQLVQETCRPYIGASDEEITTIASTPGVDLALPKTTSAKRLAERCWLAAAEKHGEFK